jgi:hypothetical protein
LIELAAGDLIDINETIMRSDEAIMVRDGIDSLLNNRLATLRYLGKG